MKNRIAMLLCTAILTLGFTIAPVMAAAGPFCPIMVDTYTYGPLDELRINKVYQLSVYDDPSGIPTEDFERGGRRYYLLDIVADNTDCEGVTYTAIFGSVELASGEKYAKASKQPEHLAFYAGIAEKEHGPDLLPILGCAGGAVIVAVIVLCAIKIKQV